MGISVFHRLRELPRRVRSRVDLHALAVENAKLHGQLRSTLTEYRSLIERLPAVTYLDDFETGDTQFISPQVIDLFGVTPEQWMADPDAWLEPIHADDRDRVREAYDAAIAARTPLQVEYRVLSPDGVVRWVVDQTVILPQVDGRRTLTQGLITDISDRKRVEQELTHRANHDSLTGLPNRHQLRSRLDEAIAHAQRTGRSLAVLYIDLDDFKLVNDTFGHEAGDELLVAVAKRLRHGGRPHDVVGRDGGDEFIVLMPDLPEDRDEATRAAAGVADRVRHALQQPLSLSTAELEIRTSVGISLYPFDAVDAQTLLNRADAAMYDAKASGRDATRAYQAGTRDSDGKLGVVASLRRAIAEGELTLRYQPIVDLHSGGLTGVEALVRWHHPERGLVSPAEFIPIAERSGLIRPLSEWVLGEAARQSAAWRAAGCEHAVSINIPPDTCRQIGAAAIVELLEASGADRSRITLEMTESPMMSARRGVIEEIEALRSLGIRLAIDDFGTGHSSLGRLAGLPVHTVKIDRSFVSGLPDDRAARTIVTAIVHLADGFGLEVIAEGVETESQRDYLRDLGCRYAQGYLFSPPVEAAEIAARWSGMLPNVSARSGRALAGDGRR